MPSPSRFIPTCFKGLPVCDHWDELKSAIKNNRVIIITGETGSGKTTQIPKICLAAGYGNRKQIACTQPRRIAAISVAERVASELGAWGRRHVGYKIRFNATAGKDTKIKFITDGMLLAEMQRYRFLNAYEIIIVDEAHERSLNIDFILGALRRLVKKRHDLKVIITSATMDTEKFREAFPEAATCHIGGRGFPVEIVYEEPETDEKGKEPCIIESAVDAVRNVLKSDPQGGDILVFLPTESDILETVRILRSDVQGMQGGKGRIPDILPIYGRLSAGEQKRIFQNTGRRKVVVATNIAETSITVPGITYVIDSGLARISRYSISSRTRALPVLPISKSSAMQRAGRAGRVKPGICIRLYSKEDFENRQEHTLPEILRSNLAEVILRLAAMGLGSAEDFPFVDPPSRQAIREGMTTLREIGALDLRGRITETGRIMARLPIDPRIARVIIQAKEENCLHPALVVAAALSIQDPRERPWEKAQEADRAHARFMDPESDFCTFLNIWQEFHCLHAQGKSRNQMRKFCRQNFLSWNRMQEWNDIYNQFLNILLEAGIISQRTRKNLDKKVLMPCSSAPQFRNKKLREKLHRSILAGFLSHAACRNESGSYLAARGREVHIFPGSALFRQKPRWFVAVEFVRTSRLFARTAAIINPEWLEDAGGAFCRHHIGEPVWSKQRGEVVATERVTLWGLTVVEARTVLYKNIDLDRAKEVFLAQGLAAGELRKKYGFIEYNTTLLNKYLDMECRTRQHGLLADQEVLVQFYGSAITRLEKDTGKIICGEADLAHAIRLAGSDAMLRLTEEFLKQHCRVPEELSLFPGHLEIDGHSLSLRYRFQPGDPADGVTAEIPLQILEDLNPAPFEWLVPGLLREKIEAMLKALPKKARKNLVPVPATVEKIMPWLEPYSKGLKQALESVLFEKTGVRITRDMWPDNQQLPSHLRMHFEVTGKRKKVIARGDDLVKLQEKLYGTEEQPEAAVPRGPAVERARKKWEKRGITLENYPELPEVVKAKGIRLYPAVVASDNAKTIDILLAASRREAARLTAGGVRHLVYASLEPQFRYIKKECMKLSVPGIEKAFSFFGSRKHLASNTWAMICQELSGSWERPPSPAEIKEHIHRLRPVMASRAQEIMDKVSSVAVTASAAMHEIAGLRTSRFAGPVSKGVADMLESELRQLLPETFPKGFRERELEQYPRYIRAIKIIAQRTVADPSRQKAKIDSLEEIRKIIAAAETYVNAGGDEYAEEALKLCSMCRELTVSVYAPELGAMKGISRKKIIKQWNELQPLLAAGG